MKYFIGLLILALLLLGAMPAGAQGSGWSAWLYNPLSGQMAQVNDTGAVVDTSTLPMPAGFDHYPERAALGHNGSPAAYVVYNSSSYQGALAVSQRDSLIANFPLPVTISDSTQFVADASLFNEDDSQVALGYSLDGSGWGVIVLDLHNGTVSNTVRFDSPLVEALGLPAGYGLTPVVRRFSGRIITLTMVQAGTEGQAHYDSYDWNLDTGTMTLNPVYPSLDSDTLASTGEVVMSLPDDRLPNQASSFTFFQTNSLQVYEPISGARYPFFSTPAQTLYSPHFIQNGELILVNSSTAATPAGWTVVGRDGLVVGTINTSITVNTLRGVPDGFIYTTDAFTPGATTLVYVDTRDGLDAGVPIWTSGAGERWLIAWAGGSAAASAQAAFTPWAQLAAPVYAPGVTPSIAVAPAQLLATPTGISPVQVTAPTPIIGRFLVVGGIAVINTTEGDQLNVRLGPGVNFAVVAKLPSGERVLLLDGPRAAEGFTWWKIRASGGVEGWAVESVNDNGTRLQTLIPG